MSRRLESLLEVMQSVTLRDVRLVQAEAATQIRNPSEISAAGVPQMTVGHHASVLATQGAIFWVAVVMTTVVHPQGASAEQSPAVRVKAMFELEYSLSEGESVGQEVLEQFAEFNGVFNAWPYAREFVQTTIARMGLPPLVLPVFRGVPPSQPAPEPAAPRLSSGATNAAHAKKKQRPTSRRARSKPRRPSR